ncbi:hypothetical protein ACIBHX_40140 [Nonomuraea sp. NPDC050536]
MGARPAARQGRRCRAGDPAFAGIGGMLTVCAYPGEGTTVHGVRGG